MRKTLTALFIAVITVSIFLTSFMYSFLSTSNKMTPPDDTVIYIEGTTRPPTRDEFFSEIKNAADSLNLNVYRIAYPPTKSDEKQKIVLYAHINDEEDFYEGIPLKSGRYLNKEDTLNYYMSSVPNNDPNCIGNIQLFDGNVNLEVRQIDSNPNDPMIEKYLINTKDDSVANKFVDNLKNSEIPIISSVSPLPLIINVDIFNAGNINNTYYIAVIMIFVVLIIMISCIIVFIYDTILRYKEIAIKKLMGYDTLKLIKDTLLNILCRYLIVWIVSYLFLFTYLYFYNGFSMLKDFIIIVTLVEFIIFVILFIFFSVSTSIIRKINITKMLKDKKSVKHLKVLNLISKAILSLFSLVICVLLFQNLVILQNTTKDSSRWDFTKNYAFVRMTIKEMSDKEDKIIRDKDQKLYELVNPKGGIMMYPNMSMERDDVMQIYKNENRPEWAYEVSGIRINNNYLKINPIYDTDGNAVEINDEYEQVFTILVPEKYKEYDDKIREHYSKIFKGFENFKYDIELRVIYVKDNQKYFTLNPTVAASSDNYFTDPIGLVYNSLTVYPQGLAIASFTNQRYYFYIDNPENPYESLAEDIKEAGLEANIITIPSLYNYVGQSFHDMQQMTIIYSILFIISLISFLVITVVSLLNYLNRNKLKLAVENLHGFSFIKKHFKLFVPTIIMWAIITLIIMNFFNLNLVISIGVSFLLIDLIIQIILVKLNELYKVKDVLKGA